mmetsp:Transcript_118089/g.341429  ORF Transcript_118089/g.341429 Transcript_118089/m.341429 type:complete len:285 (+) Transcript_118089:118-972(+)
MARGCQLGSALALGLFCAGFRWVDSARAFANPFDAMKNVDLRKVKFDDEGFVLPNGTRYDIKYAGEGKLTLPSGGQLSPLAGLESEGALPPDAFVCHDGNLFAIRMRLPQRGRRKRLSKKTTFHYVRVNTDMRNLEPIEVFSDIADELRHFLIIPPMEGFGSGFDGWSMMMRKARSAKTGAGWKEQRIFTIGPERPCAQEQQEEMQEDATGDQEAQEAGGDRRAEEDEQDPAGDLAEIGVDEEAKDGSVAADVLRSLASSRWTPAGWFAAVAGARPEVAETPVP